MKSSEELRCIENTSPFKKRRNHRNEGIPLFSYPILFFNTLFDTLRTENCRGIFLLLFQNNLIKYLKNKRKIVVGKVRVAKAIGSFVLYIG